VRVAMAMCLLHLLHNWRFWQTRTQPKFPRFAWEKIWSSWNVGTQTVQVCLSY